MLDSIYLSHLGRLSLSITWIPDQLEQHSKTLPQKKGRQAREMGLAVKSHLTSPLEARCQFITLNKVMKDLEIVFPSKNSRHQIPNGYLTLRNDPYHVSQSPLYLQNIFWLMGQLKTVVLLPNYILKFSALKETSSSFTHLSLTSPAVPSQRLTLC